MATYTSADQIAAALGVTFTPEQTTHADAVAAAVTTFVDRYTGRSWQGASPVAGETVPLINQPDGYSTAYLTHRPAVAVSAVSVRSFGPNATPSDESATEYELIDPANGVLRLGGWYGWRGYEPLLAVVDYTYADAVPTDVTLAATMIASQHMARALAVQQANAAAETNPDLAGLDSIAVGQNDISVKLSTAGRDGGAFSSAGSAWAAPGSAAAAILDGYRRVVIA